MDRETGVRLKVLLGKILKLQEWPDVEQMTELG